MALDKFLNELEEAQKARGGQKVQLPFNITGFQRASDNTAITGKALREHVWNYLHNKNYMQIWYELGQHDNCWNIGNMVGLDCNGAIYLSFSYNSSLLIAANMQKKLYIELCCKKNCTNILVTSKYLLCKLHSDEYRVEEEQHRCEAGSSHFPNINLMEALAEVCKPQKGTHRDNEDEYVRGELWKAFQFLYKRLQGKRSSSSFFESDLSKPLVIRVLKKSLSSSPVTHYQISLRYSELEEAFMFKYNFPDKFNNYNCNWRLVCNESGCLFPAVDDFVKCQKHLDEIGFQERVAIKLLSIAEVQFWRHLNVQSFTQIKSHIKDKLENCLVISGGGRVYISENNDIRVRERETYVMCENIECYGNLVALLLLFGFIADR